MRLKHGVVSQKRDDIGGPRGNRRGALSFCTGRRDGDAMTGRDIMEYAERKGWRFVRRAKGGHTIFRHPWHPYVLSNPGPRLS